MSSRGVEGLAATCQKQMWRENQPHVATGQQSSDAKDEIPFEQRAPSTPKVPNVSGYPRNSWISSDNETDCKRSCGLCTATSGGHLPHSLEDILLCAEGEQERGLQTKPEVQELTTWKKPGLCVLLMNTWMTSTGCYFCPSMFAIPYGCELSFLSTIGRRARQTKNSTPCQILNHVFWDNKNAIIFSKD